MYLRVAKHCWIKFKEKLQKWGKIKIHKDTKRWLDFVFGDVRNWEFQDKISRGFLESIGVSKETNLIWSKMLKPKMWIQICKRATNLLCLNKSNRLKLTKYAKLHDIFVAGKLRVSCLAPAHCGWVRIYVPKEVPRQH